MEQTKLKQFTFYNFYGTVIGGLSDKDAGRMINLICGYMFDEKEVALSEEDNLSYYWNYIESILEESKTKERDGKPSKGLNAKMNISFL